MKKPTFVIACTNDLLDKAEPLFLSLDKHAPDLRKCLLVIDKDGEFDYEKTATERNVEVKAIPLSELTSYRSDWPKNRDFYACAEGGEFLDYFHFDDDEVIIHLDADFIMQRPFTTAELELFASLRHGQVASTHHSFPPHGLYDEFSNLLPKVRSINIAFNMLSLQMTQPQNFMNYKMFCAGFVSCTAYTYRQISKSYLLRHEGIRRLFDHHAAGQWLLNLIVMESFSFIDTTPEVHCGAWYKDSPTFIKDGQLIYNATGKPVLFNHTKYEQFKY